MSLFRSMMFDSLEDDPIFGAHMRSFRQMNNMMNSMMSPDPFDPFGGMFRSLAAPPQMASRNALMHQSPFQFPDINPNRLLMGNMPDAGVSFSSSSFVSMTQGPDGKPLVYKATSSTKAGPGGVLETKKSVQDSRTGLQKMAIGHHIGERAHVVERQKNHYTGDEEEKIDYINLDEEEADDFDREFKAKTQMYDNSGRRYLGGSGGHHREQLALPAPPVAALPSTSSTITAHNTKEPARSTVTIEEIVDDDDEVTIVTPVEDVTPIVNTPESPPPAHAVADTPAPRTQNRRAYRNPLASSRRPLRPTSSPLATPPPTSTSLSSQATRVHPHPHPYNSNSRRHQQRGMKGHQNYHQQHHHNHNNHHHHQQQQQHQQQQPHHQH